jgi:hypothetical protein
MSHGNPDSTSLNRLRQVLYFSHVSLRLTRFFRRGLGPLAGAPVTAGRSPARRGHDCGSSHMGRLCDRDPECGCWDSRCVQYWR